MKTVVTLLCSTLLAFSVSSFAVTPTDDSFNHVADSTSSQKNHKKHSNKKSCKKKNKHKIHAKKKSSSSKPSKSEDSKTDEEGLGINDDDKSVEF